MLDQKISKILIDEVEFKKFKGKYIFKELSADEYNENTVNNFKSFIKRNNKIYELLIDILSPVFTYSSKKWLNSILRNYKNEDIVINLGSGNSSIREDVINIDIFAYDNVDIVCDILNLPFKDNSVDAIINLAVLEHVPHPDLVIKEIHRVLKSSGTVFCTFPFIQGFHASPYDFSRRTKEGMRVAYSDFEDVVIKNAGGPTSGFLWIFQEWLSIIFSFGIKPLHTILSFVFMFLTFPLKILDFVYIHHPLAHNITSAFILIAKKKS